MRFILEVAMNIMRYIHCNDYGFWISCIEERQDYVTQGVTSEKFNENLVDFYKEAKSGNLF